jgi:hypothetical protein
MQSKMDGRNKEREASTTGCFIEENFAPVLEIFTTLKRVKINLTSSNLFLI